MIRQLCRNSRVAGGHQNPPATLWTWYEFSNETAERLDENIDVSLGLL
jgi:hypothetical protein